MSNLKKILEQHRSIVEEVVESYPVSSNQIIKLDGLMADLYNDAVTTPVCPMLPGIFYSTALHNKISKAANNHEILQVLVDALVDLVANYEKDPEKYPAVKPDRLNNLISKYGKARTETSREEEEKAKEKEQKDADKEQGKEVKDAAKEDSIADVTKEKDLEKEVKAAEEEQKTEGKNMKKLEALVKKCNEAFDFKDIGSEEWETLSGLEEFPDGERPLFFESKAVLSVGGVVTIDPNGITVVLSDTLINDANIDAFPEYLKAYPGKDKSKKAVEAWVKNVVKFDTAKSYTVDELKKKGFNLRD